MRTLSLRALPLALCLLAAGCASQRSLPPYEKPIARTQFQRVRTTAYTDTESDHVQYTNHNALGTCLQSGAIHSAAADWSRWPAGTVFRIVETGEVFQVDDYGWALAGTNTIDLYKPSRELMNAWGVRRVTIENLQWGDPGHSLAVLRPRARYRHIERMVQELKERYAELSRPVPTSSAPVASVASVQPPAAAAIPVALPAIPVAPAAQPTSPMRPTSATTGVARNPFFANTDR